MLTGELRSKIDTIWNAFWSGGISNPLVMATLARLEEEIVAGMKELEGMLG